MNNQISMEVKLGTLDEAIEQFLFHCRYEKNLNTKTLNAYQTDLKQFSEIIKGRVEEDLMEKITKEELKFYLQQITDFKPKTVKRKIASLKAMFNFWEFENEQFINPFRKMKVRFKEPFVLPEVMDIREVKRILDVLYKELFANEQVKTYTYRAQVRNIAVVELLFATGMRVSELCSLKCTDVDLHSGKVKIFGKGSKERVIQICQREVLSALRNYRQQFKPVSFFFINRMNMPLTTASVRLLVKHYVKSAGITRHITPHTFRHTFATLLLEEDVDIKYIQNLLGHSSIATTQIYTHVNSNKQKKILSAKHPRRKFNMQVSTWEGGNCATAGDLAKRFRQQNSKV